MIRVGIVNPETWDFFHEPYAFLRANYTTSVFKPRLPRVPVFRERIERNLLHHDLKSFLRQNDVVFFEWSSSLLALATSIPKSCAIVTRLHRWELYSWADRINWKAVDQIILVSEAKRREFLARFPEQTQKTHVLPACVSLQQFGFVEKPFSWRIGTLCHLSPRKRIYDLILNFSDLVQILPSLRLHIAGDPDPAHVDYYSSLHSLVDKLSLNGLVQFDGYVAKSWEWYPKIDIFISNSFSEGLQVAPMEAMASGCYTLSHHWDGAEELLPENCLYVTGNHLQDKIVSFCGLTDFQKERERIRMRDLAVERFDIERANQQIGEIIEQSARMQRAGRAGAKTAAIVGSNRSVL